MAEYTTAALMTKRLENYDTSLLTADIEAMIEVSEGIVNAIMGASFLTGKSPGGFDATDHGIVRAGTEAWTGLSMIAFNPAGFTTLAEAVAIAEVLAYQWEQIRSVLENKSVVQYLESL